ncbi:MAG: fused MFS/spermidine synthase [Deltaproteobacteria bacterium]|nr:fused MFS/spermidine synthase [Deltaproteobacteria bacterium]
MWIPAATVFLGAFLLFLVQPIVGRYVLPWFGGGAQVWTTCLLLFQTLLLAGYAYAHAVARALRPRRQLVLHVLLLVAAVAALPIIPSTAFRPADPGLPALRILLLVTVTVGLPFLVLAATGPLVQSWFTRTHPERSPYRLLALSNAGSLLGLLSYPLVLEPLFARRTQAVIWSWSLVAFAALGGAYAVAVWRSAPAGGRAGKASDEPPDPTAASAAPRRTASWLVLPAVASVLLMAVTNAVGQELTVAPVLWVVPLAVYLLSFVVCFDRPRWYVRPLFVGLFVPLAGVVLWMQYATRTFPAWAQLGAYAAALFTGCMICHGELALRKPHPAHVTRYNLSIAAGGAAGGLFVAGVAPLLFRSWFELPLGLAACCLAAAFTTVLSPERPVPGRLARLLLLLGALAGLALGTMDEVGGGDRIVAVRNFYGVLTVRQVGRGGTDGRRLVLQHGGTIHGLQFTDPDRRLRPTAYYGPSSGVGRALAAPAGGPDRRIGAIGLGVGTIAAYGRPGDILRFYELNPAVVELARTRFTFLRDSKARVDVVLGDARLALEREPANGFDLLVVDAFGGDAVPMHLLTSEAFATYVRHLRPRGMLAFHVSSRHLDLAAVVLAQAVRLGWTSCVVDDPGGEPGILPSDWVLLAPDRAAFEAPAWRGACAPAGSHRQVRPWTDERASLLDVVRWR